MWRRVSGVCYRPWHEMLWHPELVSMGQLEKRFASLPKLFVRLFAASGTLMAMRHDESMHAILEEHGLRGGSMGPTDWQQLIDISFTAAASSEGQASRSNTI